MRTRDFTEPILWAKIFLSTMGVLGVFVAPEKKGLFWTLWLAFAVYAITTPAIYRHDFRQIWRIHRAETAIVVLWGPWMAIWGAKIALVCHWLGLGANVWIVTRMVRRAYGRHPIFSSAYGLVSVLGLVIALLPQVEPQTFPNWKVALWFAAETITTVGYGDVAPTSGLGKLLSLFLMVIGGILYSALGASVSHLLLLLAHWSPPSQRHPRSPGFLEDPEADNGVSEQEVNPLRIEELLEQLSDKVDTLDKLLDAERKRAHRQSKAVAVARRRRTRRPTRTRTPAQHRQP